jgi:hypothetical protein
MNIKKFKIRTVNLEKTGSKDALSCYAPVDKFAGGFYGGEYVHSTPLLADLTYLTRLGLMDIAKISYSRESFLCELGKQLLLAKTTILEMPRDWEALPKATSAVSNYLKYQNWGMFYEGLSEIELLRLSLDQMPSNPCAKLATIDILGQIPMLERLPRTKTSAEAYAKTGLSKLIFHRKVISVTLKCTATDMPTLFRALGCDRKPQSLRRNMFKLAKGTRQKCIWCASGKEKVDGKPLMRLKENPIQQYCGDYCSKNGICVDIENETAYNGTNCHGVRKIMAKNGDTPRLSVHAPIAILTYNRPKYLLEALTAINSLDNLNKSMVTVIQYGRDEETTSVAKMFPFDIKTRNYDRTLPNFPHVHITHQYEFAIRTLFNKFPVANGVIILEDDLIVSKHFLSLMSNMILAVNKDKSIFASSAFNPNDGGLTSASCLSKKGLKFLRAHTFEHLGWYLPRRSWDGALREKWGERRWPKENWDWKIRWLVLDIGQSVLYPMLSHVKYVGRIGSHSNNVFFNQYFLKRFHAMESSNQFSNAMTSKEAYEKKLKYSIKLAHPVNQLKDLRQVSSMSNIKYAIIQYNASSFEAREMNHISAIFMPYMWGVVDAPQGMPPKGQYGGVHEILFGCLRLFLVNKLSPFARSDVYIHSREEFLSLPRENFVPFYLKHDTFP